MKQQQHRAFQPFQLHQYEQLSNTVLRGNKPFKPRNHSPSSSEWPQIFMSRWMILQNTPAKSYNSQPRNSWFLAPSSESPNFQFGPPFSGASRYRYFQVVPYHQSWVAEVPMVTWKNSLSMGLLPRPGHSRIKGNFFGYQNSPPFRIRSSPSRNRSWQVRNQSPAPGLRRGKT